jgi:hypothetical protein
MTKKAVNSPTLKMGLFTAILLISFHARHVLRARLCGIPRRITMDIRTDFFYFFK